MSFTLQEGPNPLRPYYIPPSVGLPQDPISHSTGTGISSKHTPSTTNFGSSARDILSDLDYTEYLSDSSPSAAELLKGFADRALWKYTSVLLAQPFEVAKTILQCHAVPGVLAASAAEDMKRRPRSYEEDICDDLPLDDSDFDEPSYFTSSAATSFTRSSSLPHHNSDPASYARPSAASSSPHKLDLRRPDSLLEVLSQLWQKEGAWGLWKGANTSFVYSILHKTIESWSRSLLSALLNVPDPGLVAGAGVGGLDIVDSPYPLASLGIAVAAAGLAGLLLAPLDMVRTRLVLTPTAHHPHGMLASLRSLAQLTCPLSLLPITLLTSTIPSLISSSTPLFLRSRLGIDPVLTPTTYSISTFTSSSIELFIRLPLETVLRRGQMAASVPPSTSTGKYVQSDTVVDIGAYKGVVGTMWHIVREEGGGQTMTTGTGGALAVMRVRARRKGQGVEGLWRGWRVGMWGLVGVWGAAALGSTGGKGGEF
ncbi:MAG: mitochondrial fusion and transport protein ugo1 [Candelina submexicana]|nr:MAG: mitochondrial fusion and transport protein ugo1 [Candelina submexicana]